jgi:transcription elongation factor B subunit 1
MLAGGFAESKGEIKFPEISTNILEKVIQYLYYKVCMSLPHMVIMSSHFTLVT